MRRRLPAYLAVLTAAILLAASVAYPAYDYRTTATLFRQTNTATVGNSVNEGTLLGSGSGSLTLPADFFKVGRTVRILMWGYVSTTSTPTLRLKLKLGSTTVLDSTATGAADTSSTNFPLVQEYTITCRTTGASGTVQAQGANFYLWAASGNAAAVVDLTATSTTTIDTTAAQTIDVTAQWGTLNSANTTTTTNVIVTYSDAI